MNQNKKLVRSARRVRGANMVEYMIVVGVVALGALGAMGAFSGKVNGAIDAQGAKVQQLGGAQ